MGAVSGAYKRISAFSLESLFVRKREPGPPRDVYVNAPIPESFKDPKKKNRVRKEHVYRSNQVITSKYNVITFLPRNLLEQFRRVANIFFLGIAILQFFPKFGTISPGLVILPLLIVLGITALKDGYEDIKRHQSDRRVNETKIHVLAGDKVINENAVEPKQRNYSTLVLRAIWKLLFRKRRKGDEEDGDGSDVDEKKAGRGTENAAVYDVVEYDDDDSDEAELRSMPSRPSEHHRRRVSLPGHPKMKTRPHWAPVKWEDLRVGSFVRLKNNQPLPADVLICATSEDENVCYVETKNLDGETNLKSRNACAGLTGLRTAGRCVKGPREGGNSWWWVECDRPEEDMYRLNAAVHIPLKEDMAPRPSLSSRYSHRRSASYAQSHRRSESGTSGAAHAGSASGNEKKAPVKEERYPVDMQNVLLRGTVVRNTSWVIGVVLFTGEDTKIVLNSGGTPSKRSKVERQMNPQVFINLFLLALMAIACAIVDSVNEHADYPAGAPWLYGANLPDDNPSINGLVTWAFALITFQNIVPISLYISIEFVRTCQAAFIYFDSEMYYAKNDTPTMARSWNLSDDLGQIEYVFSDKTGTLTQNSMVFRQCSIGGKVYAGDPEPEEIEDVAEIPVPGQNKEKDDNSSSTSAAAKERRENNSNGQTQSTSEHRTSETAVPDPLAPTATKTPLRVRHHFTNAALASDISSAVNSPHADPTHARNLNGFFTVLALCHSVLTSVDPETGAIEYKAQSPDEAALVQAAADVGYVFRGREREVLTLQTPFSSSSSGSSRPGSRDRERDGAAPSPQPPPHERIGSGFHPSAGAEAGGEDGLERYELLNILEFTSARKRMGVVLRRLDGEDDRIFLLVKGADNVIFERLRPGAQEELKGVTDKHLDEFASQGLRTLTLAYKVINEDEYTAWNDRYHEATVALKDREEKIEAVSDELERDLRLLGATAIEDKLQDGVPETIADLKRAGIKVWVLTGDKLETAIAIGHSTNLISRDSNIIVVRGTNDTKRRSVYQQMAHAAEEFFPESKILENSKMPESELARNKDGEPGLARANTGVSSIVGNDNGERPGGFVLVIDGHALTSALADEEHKSLLLKLALQCEGVICCRVSPLQKALVTRMVKNGLKVMTLAIGDGANDVSMIQAADVGVGISGEEGLQAVNSSDYAIAQFRFLKRLLLVHGHWSYARNGNMIVNFFYKNIVCIGVLWWFQIYDAWSSAYAFEYTYLLWWNSFWTIAPVIAIGLFDRIADAEVLMALPELYKYGREGTWFGLRKFIIFMLDGIMQSAIIFFVIANTYMSISARDDGYNVYQYEFATTMAVTAVMTANLFNGLNTAIWTGWVFFAVFVGIVLIWGYTAIYSLISPGWFHTPVFGNDHYLFRSAYFWFCLPLCICVCLLPRYLGKALRFGFAPHDLDIMRFVRKTEPHRDITIEAQPTSALKALKRMPSYSSAAGQNSRMQSAVSLPSPPRPSGDLRSASRTDMATGLRSMHRGFDFSTEEGGVAMQRMQSNLSVVRQSHRSLPRQDRRTRKKSHTLGHILSLRRHTKRPEPSENA